MAIKDLLLRAPSRALVMRAVSSMSPSELYRDIRNGHLPPRTLNYLAEALASGGWSYPADLAGALSSASQHLTDANCAIVARTLLARNRHGLNAAVAGRVMDYDPHQFVPMIADLGMEEAIETLLRGPYIFRLQGDARLDAIDRLRERTDGAIRNVASTTKDEAVVDQLRRIDPDAWSADLLRNRELPNPTARAREILQTTANAAAIEAAVQKLAASVDGGSRDSTSGAGPVLPQFVAADMILIASAATRAARTLQKQMASAGERERDRAESQILHLSALLASIARSADFSAEGDSAPHALVEAGRAVAYAGKEWHAETLFFAIAANRSLPVSVAEKLIEASNRQVFHTMLVGNTGLPDEFRSRLVERALLRVENSIEVERATGKDSIEARAARVNAQGCAVTVEEGLRSTNLPDELFDLAAAEGILDPDRRCAALFDNPNIPAETRYDYAREMLARAASDDRGLYTEEKARLTILKAFRGSADLAFVRSIAKSYPSLIQMEDIEAFAKRWAARCVGAREDEPFVEYSQTADVLQVLARAIAADTAASRTDRETAEKVLVTMNELRVRMLDVAERSEDQTDEIDALIERAMTLVDEFTAAGEMNPDLAAEARSVIARLAALAASADISVAREAGKALRNPYFKALRARVQPASAAQKI